MYSFGIASLLLTATLLGQCASAEAQPERSDALVVSRTEAGYKLGVPVSRLVMTIPDASLRRQVASGGATNNPRYFSFNDTNRGLVISGWFEPAQSFVGLPTFWSNETASWAKQGLPKPQNVEMLSVGGWQVVCYELEIADTKNIHVRAHWVQAGTWIDMHISLTGKPSNGVSKDALLDMLKKITVAERNDG